MGRCIVFAIASAVALVFAATAQAGTFRGHNGRIAFMANGQVFSMRTDGSARRQLTHDGAGAADPDWSATGGLLVYARSDGLVSFVSSTGTLRATMSTQEPISDPAFSPDGRRLVFTVNGDGLFDGPSIYVANVDGTQLQRLGPGSSPQWSPDGNWIAYVSIPADTGCSGVRLMQPDGSVDHPVAEPRTGPNGTCHDAAITAFTNSDVLAVIGYSALRFFARMASRSASSVSVRFLLWTKCTRSAAVAPSNTRSRNV